MDNTTEEWIPIRGASGYEISNMGNIKKGGKLLKKYAKDTYIKSPGMARMRFSTANYVKIKYDGSLNHVWCSINYLADIHRPNSIYTGIIWI